MNSISESELTDFVKNDAVKKISIVQNKNNNYQLEITLTWKKGTWHLVTTRGKVREWICLNRLTRHIKTKYDGALPPINLKLNQNKSTEKETNETQ